MSLTCLMRAAPIVSVAVAPVAAVAYHQRAGARPDSVHDIQQGSAAAVGDERGAALQAG